MNIEKYTITNPNTNETINMVKHEHPEFLVRNKQTNQLYDSANDLESLGYEYEVTDVLRETDIPVEEKDVARLSDL